VKWDSHQKAAIQWGRNDDVNLPALIYNHKLNHVHGAAFAGRQQAPLRVSVSV